MQQFKCNHSLKLTEYCIFMRYIYAYERNTILIKGECSVFVKKKYIMDEDDSLSEYIKISLGHNRPNGAVYSKINFKVEISSAH